MRLPRATRTASFRLAALYALLFGASVLTLGAVVYWSARSALDQQMTARIEAEIAALQQEYRAGGLERLRAAVHAREHAPGALDYLVQAPDGSRLAGELPRVDRRLVWINVTIGDGTKGEEKPERLRARIVALDGGNLLAVGDDLARIEEVEETILTALAWAFALTVVLGVGGGFVLSIGFLRRVDAISRTAEGIIDGDLTRRIPVRDTGDDLDRLASTLNRMLDRIGALMESLHQISSDVAHDLRTPLTRPRQRLEMARSHAGSLDDYESAVEGAVADTDSILETFAALLRIAQIEGGSRRAQFQRVDLGRIAEAVVDALAPAAEDEGHRLTAAIAVGVTIDGDKELLTQMIFNLVENGIRHTPRDSAVEVAVTAVDGAARLVVQDDGPGVPGEERQLLFQRFYRREESRTTPGSGLGLSLVAAVADLHDARWTVDDASPGLRIAVTFRIAAPR